MDWKHFDEYKAFLFQGRVLWKGNDGQWKCTCKEFGKDFYCVDSVAVNHGTSIRIIPKDFRKRNLTLPPRGKGRPRNGIGKALDLPYILANSQAPAQVLALDENQNYNSSDDSDYVSEARDDQSDMSDSDDDDDDYDHEAPLMQQRDDEVHSVSNSRHSISNMHDNMSYSAGARLRGMDVETDGGRQLHLGSIRKSNSNMNERVGQYRVPLAMVFNRIPNFCNLHHI